MPHEEVSKICSKRKLSLAASITAIRLFTKLKKKVLNTFYLFKITENKSRFNKKLQLSTPTLKFVTALDAQKTYNLWLYKN